ncbi:MAG TPA: hypothetical protein VHY78_10255 [Stellaceae bacterium]|nr:hypothetical protein [Stellaceae bacterium]
MARAAAGTGIIIGAANAYKSGRQPRHTRPDAQPERYALAIGKVGAVGATTIPVKAFYFANGGGNSIPSGTAVSAGKYTARVGEEALRAGRPGAAAKLKLALDSPLEESGFEPLVPLSESAQPRHQPDVADRQHPSCITNPSCQFNQHLCRKWDQRFESAFLQR